jgi:hypothetical protein
MDSPLMDAHAHGARSTGLLPLPLEVPAAGPTTVAGLKVRLRALGLGTTGLKAELAARIMAHEAAALRGATRSPSPEPAASEAAARVQQISFMRRLICGFLGHCT